MKVNMKLPKILTQSMNEEVSSKENHFQIHARRAADRDITIFARMNVCLRVCHAPDQTNNDRNLKVFTYTPQDHV